MSTVILLGAGASFGSGECIPGPPPLGKQLFSELQRAGGSARTIQGATAAAFHDDFEQGMVQFFDDDPAGAIALLRETAAYFARFRPGDENLYHQLVALLIECRRAVVLATTNYDLMIEHAICAAGWRVTYTGFPVPRENIPVVKIHGSCNFLPDAAGAIRGLGFIVRRGMSILDAPVRMARSPAEIEEFCTFEDSIAPAIAMYAPGKQVLFCERFVREQQKAFAREVGTARHVYIVGTRIREDDAHIWNPIARSSAALWYAGGEPDEFNTWAGRKARRNHTLLAETFQDALPRLGEHLRR